MAPLVCNGICVAADITTDPELVAAPVARGTRVAPVIIRLEELAPALPAVETAVCAVTLAALAEVLTAAAIEIYEPAVNEIESLPVPEEDPS